MRVHPPSIHVSDTEARLSATVESEFQAFEPFQLTISVPRQYVGWLDPSGNAFLPTLLLLAGVLDESLNIEAPVSPRSLAGSHAANDLYQQWWGVSKVDIQAAGHNQANGLTSGSTALFFTRGVDSWYSALRAQRGMVLPSVSHLIYVADLDRQYSPQNRQRAIAATREAAGKLGIHLIPVSHNGRELLDRFVNWERSHGAVLAGIGLALGQGLRGLVIASSYDHKRLIPWGSHPSLDPLWSTEHTQIFIDGVDCSRTNKVRLIASSAVARTRLKVCWHADTVTNCGVCEKCMRTQIAIKHWNVKIPQEIFEQSAKLTDLTEIDLKPERLVYWEELLEETGDSEHLSDWHDAIRARLSPASSVRPRVEVPAETAVGLLPRSLQTFFADLPQEIQEDLPSEPTLEVTWGEPTSGRIPLPLRPASSHAMNVLNMCRNNERRPIAWCIIDHPTLENVALVRWLCNSWGNGITSYHEDRTIGGDHGTPWEVAETIQLQSRMRCWWSEIPYLDPFRVLAAVEYGCLPQVFVSPEVFDVLKGQLPYGLEAFVRATDCNTPIEMPDQTEIEERLDQGLSVLLKGSFERDWHHACALLGANE